MISSYTLSRSMRSWYFVATLVRNMEANAVMEWTYDGIPTIPRATSGSLTNLSMIVVAAVMPFRAQSRK